MSAFLNDKNRVARISNHVLYKHKSAVKEAIRMEGYHKFLSRFSIGRYF